MILVTKEKSAFDQQLLSLLEATEAAGAVWRDTVKQMDAVSDEVWLEQMYELDRLEARYRSCQDQICHYLRHLANDCASFSM